MWKVKENTRNQVRTSSRIYWRKGSPHGENIVEIKGYFHFTETEVQTFLITHYIKKYESLGNINAIKKKNSHFVSVF